jgi:hypothetical protein
VDELVCNTHGRCEPLGGEPNGAFEALGYVFSEPTEAWIQPGTPLELLLLVVDGVGTGRVPIALRIKEDEIGEVIGSTVNAFRPGTMHVQADWSGRVLTLATIHAVDYAVDRELPIEVHVVPRARQMSVDAAVPLYVRAYAASGDRVMPRLAFESSNPEVASVSREGVVTALAPGQARISVSTQTQPSLRTTFSAVVVGDSNSKIAAINPCIKGPFAGNCTLFDSEGQLHAIVDRVCQPAVFTTTYGTWTSEGDAEIDRYGVITKTGSATISFVPELATPELNREPLCYRRLR